MYFFSQASQGCNKIMDLDSFQKDSKTLDAVIRNFIIIGEAARNIPDEISERYP